MTPHALLFTLSAIGISETAYLIKMKIRRKRPICVIGEDCHQVLESRYNNILGIPNEVSGLVFYIVISFITALLVIGIEPMYFWEGVAQVLITLATLMSIIFTYLQWQVIKAWCFWCLMSAFTVFAMAVIVLTSDLVKTI